MTGLPRRNKRSHDADAAEPGNEGQAAEPERAPTEDAPTQQLPVTDAASEQEAAPLDPGLAELVKGDDHTDEARGDEAGVAPDAAGEPAAVTGELPVAEGEPPLAEGQGRTRRFPSLRRRRNLEPLPPEEPLPQPLDPAMPAGLEPAELAARAPVGRRGRLRRRLRYLRRARELMLRDLGGLVYEVHRTGGGDVNAHRSLLGAKVQRLANVERETHAIEDALMAPRADAVVFQPGIGGSCPVCAELYGSAARFCANCGTPLGVTPAVGGPPALHEPVPPAGPIGPATAAPVRTPAAPAIPDAPAAHAPLGLAPAPKPAESPNGHAGTPPPELSSGDPLAARERP